MHSVQRILGGVRRISPSLCGGSVCLLFLAACSQPFTTALIAGDAKAREAAVTKARQLGPQGIDAVGPLLGHADPAVVAAARRSLWAITYESTRPEAGTARVETTTALLGLLKAHPDLPARERSELLHMTALVADDAESIRTVDGYLDDSELAAAAIFALERISHPAAERALMRRLRQPSALPVTAYINALGSRRSVAAVEGLMKIATDQGSAEAQAARTALARIGDPRAEPLLLRAAGAGSDRKAAKDWLYYLDLRLAADPGRAAEAMRSYESMLKSPTPSLRVAAIAGLSRIGKEYLEGPMVFDAIFQQLGDRDRTVRRVSQAALVSLTDRDIAKKLTGALASSSPTVQAGILRVLTRRGVKSALALVRASARDPSSPVRLTALELCGDLEAAELEPILVEACKNESEEIRSVAAASLYRHAGYRLAKDEEEAALSLLHQVLQATADKPIVAASIAEIARIASPASLESLVPLANNPDYREPIARAHIAIARKMVASDRTQALELLHAAYDRSTNRSTLRSAASQLAKLDVPMRDLQHRAGLLTTWMVLGPFPKCKKDNLGAHAFGDGFERYFGKDGPSLTEARTQSEISNLVKRKRKSKSKSKSKSKIQWHPVEADKGDGAIDLRIFKKNSNASAYAACDIDWKGGSRQLLKVGSDDGVAVWVNGELVHQNFVQRGVKLDDDECRIHLRPGKNRILVKVNQGGGGWGFCVRLADGDGKPIDLTKLTAK